MIRTNIGHPATKFQWTPSWLRWPTPGPSTVWSSDLGMEWGRVGTADAAEEKGIYKPMLPPAVKDASDPMSSGETLPEPLSPRDLYRTSGAGRGLMNQHLIWSVHVDLNSNAPSAMAPDF